MSHRDRLASTKIPHLPPGLREGIQEFHWDNNVFLTDSNGYWHQTIPEANEFAFLQQGFMIGAAMFSLKKRNSVAKK